MLGVEVELPGGLPTENGIERRVVFRPLTGRVEQALIEMEESQNRSNYVTAVLFAALDRIGDQSMDKNAENAKKIIGSLCVADRHYLMLRLGIILNGEQMWLKVDCRHCDMPFDVDVKRCDLPVKEAGNGYPVAKLIILGQQIEACVPTGRDQIFLADQTGDDAVQQLLKKCIKTPDGEALDQTFFNSLSKRDIETIDDALDEISPAVCNELLVVCPECGQQQNAQLDHSFLGQMDRYSFYDEVHTLASHYHWSEDQILDLPKDRRRLYLNMINRSSGMSVQGV